MRNDREWLLDILEAIERIEKYSSKGRQAFEEDELRNILVHRYFELDTDLVWKAVINDLPDLKDKVRAALEEGNDKQSW